MGQELYHGFENHNSTRITRGGENGRPINFWNDSNTSEHQQIKATLDQGNIDIFGMTAGHEPEDSTEGHRAWINYALQNNPNIIIFIAIPQIDFPADWEQRAQEYGFETIQELYDYFVNDIVHNEMVDQLRIEFPSTKIFTIPTGWASVNLDQMNIDNELLDQISRFGPNATSLFVEKNGTISGPIATLAAPVNVAISIIISGFSSSAKVNASASINLPSASVLRTSMVLPL